MYLSVTSVSTRADASSDTDADDETVAASVPLETEDGATPRTDERRGAPADAGTADDANADGESGSDPVRTRLVESTVVAAITGVFVILGGAAGLDPRLSLPVALAGVLWLFVRTLPSMRGRRGDDTPEAGVDDPAGVTSTDGGVEGAAVEPRRPSPPVSTDRRLKMEVASHGGRMMQKELVESVDLSESAVSRRLSKLEANDEVGRVCLGRENLVYLEGSRPDGADSPYAEE